MMWRRNSQSGDSLFDLLEKLRRRDLATVATVWELSGNNKRRTLHSLGDREPSVLFGNRPKTKEHQRHVIKPIGASQASTEISLE